MTLSDAMDFLRTCAADHPDFDKAVGVVCAAASRSSGQPVPRSKHEQLIWRDPFNTANFKAVR